jgi:hypothetical protein
MKCCNDLIYVDPHRTRVTCTMQRTKVAKGLLGLFARKIRNVFQTQNVRTEDAGARLDFCQLSVVLARKMQPKLLRKLSSV